ncbi:hypothetical protein, conserved [Plasmodium gonderi]|uniref:RAP domain-containing protein n=1 Tax=Plasmodium gonderi TaxID=77519 RepID=A0A1Y1JGE5_PLAGO|nr:hypothetical protein, conserved [Plasmodium gonderi]GAW81320.1 hypothetical protein, conserved [Plasmodium gonderi]
MILMSFLNGTKKICERKKEKLVIWTIFQSGKNLKKAFSNSSKHKSKGVPKNLNGKDKFIQLHHSDSATRYHINGIMKANNWPKKNISKKQNELYIFLKNRDNKNVDFHELNIVLTKKIGNMQNFNEVYKFIYYNKDILVPINYVICIYKIYKLTKKKNCSIVNYNMYINNSIVGLNIDQLGLMADLDQVNNYEELNQKLSIPMERRSIESIANNNIHDRGGKHTGLTKKKPSSYETNQYELDNFCFDYKNDILQYVLEKLNKNYFIKKLTYRHLSNLLFALINLKYYNIVTYMVYVKYITNMYIHLSSQAISNITHSYALLFNYYSIDFTTCYENYVYKYYTLSDKNINLGKKHDHINFMFLLLSRWMCIKAITHFNKKCNAKYDMDIFYKGFLSNTEELNEKEKKYNVQFNSENVKYENEHFFQEFFIFLWSISKLKINNIYIDFMYYIIHQNRKYIFLKLNEKDVCNFIQSICTFYPIKKLRQTYVSNGGNSSYAFCLRNEKFPTFDYDAFLRSSLLLALVHLKKCTYQHYSIIFKILRNVQNWSQSNSEGVPNWGDPRTFSQSAEKENEVCICMLSEELDPYSKNNPLYKKGDIFLKEYGEKETLLNCRKRNSIEYIIKKLTKVLVKYLIIKLESENDQLPFVINYNKYSSSLNLQHLSIYLYNSSIMDEFYLENKIREKLTKLLISILEKIIKHVHTFDKKCTNLKYMDDFLQKNYEHLVCLSNINYALNKNNIINESIVLHSSIHFYKLYHVFYNAYRNTERSELFFNFLEKINERVLSIYNWTSSHTCMSLMPLFSLINYNYLYILYKKDIKNKLVLLKKMLLPITIYNNITLNQLRLTLKILINYYMSYLECTEDSSNNYLHELENNHDDILTCMYSLSLIITNISHNIRKTNNIQKNIKTNNDKCEHVYFYINIANILLRKYFYKLYSLNVGNIKKYILSHFKNEEIIMKFYTFYLFVKINMNNTPLEYDRNTIKKFISSITISKKGFYFLEKLISSFSQQNEESSLHRESETEDSKQVHFENSEFLAQVGNGKVKEKMNNDKTQTNDNFLNEEVYTQSTSKNRMNKFPLYSNNINNKNYSPRENLGIFFLIQKRIHQSEIKMNKKIFLFLKHPHVFPDIFNPSLDNELRKVEEQVLLAFKQIKSSKSHLKLYDYIKYIYEKKKDGKKESFHIKNEYITNKNNALFVVDIYDENTNTIFEIDGISHYSKQYIPNKSFDSFNYFYNYKSCYIFKHLVLSKFYNILHLPLHNGKLCKSIICNHYSEKNENIQ